MNGDFGEYLEKKSDMYRVECSCGHKYYVFVKLEGGYSICRTCSKKHYELSCVHCESGVNYEEGSKEIDLINNTWKCVECQDTNKNIPTTILKDYLKEDIPADVWAEEKKRRLTAGWIPKLFFLILVSLYIYFQIILK